MARLPAPRAEVVHPDLFTDRWLIEALSQMSSNPRVREAAAAWLGAHTTALSLGLGESEAQLHADRALQRMLEPARQPRCPRLSET